MTHEDVKNNIRKFLDQSDVNSAEIGDDDDLFKLKIIDSLMLLRLVLHVEGEFNISINTDLLNEVNFRSLNTIATLILEQR